MTDVLLVCNAVIAAVVVVVLTMGTVHSWDELTPRVKRIVPWIILTYVVIAYGSGEAAADPDDLDGYRFTLVCLNLLGLLIALLYHPRGERHTP